MRMANLLRIGGLVLVICAMQGAILQAMPQAVPQAMAQNVVSPGKNCRMEQQCHWENFKKVCVWVKVCR
jgi:uncharacterized membrane protein